MRLRCLVLSLATNIAVATASAPLRAEVKDVVLGAQYGAVYLPAMAMESQKLVEKHLAADGLLPLGQRHDVLVDPRIRDVAHRAARVP